MEYGFVNQSGIMAPNERLIQRYALLMKKRYENFVGTDDRQALKELKTRLVASFDIEKIVLYGSVARAESDSESDSDLFIMTRRPMDRFERHRITDMIFEINMLYGTNFSSLVVDRDSWEAGPVSILPFHEEIRRDGISI